MKQATSEPNALQSLEYVSECLSVGTDCKVVDSQVHTNNFFYCLLWNVFGEGEQEESSSFPVNSQQAFFHIPTEVVPVTFWNAEWNFDSAFDSSKTQDTVFERKHYEEKLYRIEALLTTGLDFAFLTIPQLCLIHATASWLCNPKPFSFL